MLSDAILRDVAVLRTRLVQLLANRTAIVSQVAPTRMLIQRARNDTNIVSNTMIAHYIVACTISGAQGINPIFPKYLTGVQGTISNLLLFFTQSHSFHAHFDNIFIP